jgi:hypothetical protein
VVYVTHQVEFLPAADLILVSLFFSFSFSFFFFFFLCVNSTYGDCSPLLYLLTEPIIVVRS